MDNKIIFVDTDMSLFSVVKDILGLYQYEVLSADSEEKIDEFDFEKCSLVMLDWMFSHSGGMKIFEKIRERGYRGEVLMMSARSLSNDQRLKFEQLGIKFIAKPFTPTNLTFTVAKIFDK